MNIIIERPSTARGDVLTEIDIVEPSSAPSLGFGVAAEATASYGENISVSTDEKVTIFIKNIQLE